MTPDNAVGWAQYLTNPYALAGFVVLIFISLLAVFKFLPTSKLKSAETSSLLRLVIIFGAILGILAIGLGFVSELYKPKQQVIRNIKNSDVAQGGKQATTINDQQKSTMNPADCITGDQIIDGVENSRVAQAGCEATTTAR